MPLWFLSVSQQSNSHKTVLTSHFRLRAAAAPLHPEGATPSAKRPWSLSLSDPERGRRACAFSSLFSDDALHGRSGWRVGRGRRAAAGGMTSPDTYSSRAVRPLASSTSTSSTRLSVRAFSRTRSASCRSFHALRAAPV